MKETKLFKLLHTFSLKEIKELELFVNSPFFTSGKNYSTEKVVKLMNIITGLYPFDERNFPGKEQIYSLLYPGKKYNDPVLRNLFSNLYGLAEEYLKIKRFKENSFEGEHYLLIEFFERRLNKEFEKQTGRNYSILKERIHSPEYFYDKHRTDDYNHHYLSGSEGFKYNETQEMINSFHMFYISRVMQLFLLAVNLENMINFRFTLPLYEEVLKHINESPSLFEENKLILIYYNLVLMLRTKEEKFYYSLKELFSRNYSVLETVDRNNLFICLGNYCLDKISQGDEKFHLEKFDNDCAYLSSGLIYRKQSFNVSLFLGIAMNAVKLRKFEWTENFLKENISRVSADSKLFCENYISAEILYAQKNYGEALKKLAVISTDFPYHKQMMRNLTAKIYFDLNYFDETESVINSSLKFLKGDFGQQEDVKKDMKLFLKYLGLLLKIKQQLKEKNKAGFTELSLLKKELASIQHFRNKDWLNEAIGKLTAK
ncbi:MAG: hypothetical protein J0M37_02495 [Ignavibacteria bacterium]|nr:hypothetical protein [Ignavibacteria bacterium]